MLALVFEDVHLGDKTIKKKKVHCHKSQGGGSS